VDLVARALDAPAAALIRVVGAGQAEVVHGWGALHRATGPQVDLPAPLATTAWATQPQVIRDWRAGGVVPPSPAPGLADVRSSLTVGVPLERRPCALTVLDPAVGRFGDLEVDFVQSVAHLLGS
jgi:hypothetical protein